MEDIYEERPSHDYADGFVAGIILGRSFGSADGSDEDGLSVNNTALWNRMARPRNRIYGFIRAIVVAGTVLWSIAMIVALLICGFTEGFNF